MVWNFKIMGEKSAEVLIYEEIGSFWGLPASEFKKELDAAGEIENLTVRINSMGGSVFEGFAIHTLLSQHPANVAIKIDGIAASIASVIAMAGNTIEIAENGFVMIHEPWTIMGGTAREFRAEADVLDKLQVQAVSSYVKKTGLPEFDVVAMIDGGKETWLNATEAVEKGFATAITEPSKAAALTIDRSLFPNAPAVLKHRPMAPAAAEKVQQAKAEREAEAVAIRLRLLDIDAQAV